MKKRIVLLTLSLLFVMVAFNDAVAVETIRLAHNENPDWTKSVDQAEALVLKTIIETGSKGEYKVEIYPASQLGGSRETVRQISRGAIKMGLVNLAHLESLYKPLELLNMPYIFDAEEVAAHLFNDSKYGKKFFNDVAEETGIRILSIGRLAFRHTTNNKRSIHTPQDLKGLKIRVMQVPSHMKLIEELGGNPTPIAWTELYSALETGMADGQENPFQPIMVASLYEVQKYMTLDKHVLTYKGLAVNEKWYQSLDARMKHVLDHAARDGAKVSYAIGRIADANGLEELGKYMEIYVPTDEDMQKFQEATIEPLKNYMIERHGLDKVTELLKAIDESEKALGY